MRVGTHHVWLSAVRVRAVAVERPPTAHIIAILSVTLLASALVARDVAGPCARPYLRMQRNVISISKKGGGGGTEGDVVRLCMHECKGDGGRRGKESYALLPFLTPLAPAGARTRVLLSSDAVARMVPSGCHAMEPMARSCARSSVVTGASSLFKELTMYNARVRRKDCARSQAA